MVTVNTSFNMSVLMIRISVNMDMQIDIQY